MADTMDIDTDPTPLVASGSKAATAEVGHSTTEPDDSTVLPNRSMSWLKSRPRVSVNPNIALVDLRSEDAGRGVSTSTSLNYHFLPPTADHITNLPASSHPLFTIPHSSTLSALTSPLTTHLIPDAMAKLGQEDPWLALVLVLFYETRLDSEWKPYIELLLRDFGEAEEKYKNILGPIINSHKDLFQAKELQFNSSIGEVDESSLLSCAHRMASCIMSYSFDIKKLNPIPTPRTTPTRVPKTKKMKMRNTTMPWFPLPTYSTQITLYNDYGPLPKSDLLRGYGNNHWDEKPTLSPEVELKRIDFLIEQELLEDAFDLPIPEPRAKNIPSEEPQLPSSSSALKKVMKTREYRECIRKILRESLAMYPPKEKIEEGLASGEEVFSRTKGRVAMARQVREGEIAILETQIKEVEGWIVEEEEDKPAKEDGRKKRKVGSSNSSSSAGDNRKKARK
ncbi:hypothetical protein EV426DRAFT_699070 [Tirmania nivea]|nr:hypothetical protein EV426DRAFT_699070 [Tirmania nivea]